MMCVCVIFCSESNNRSLSLSPETPLQQLVYSSAHFIPVSFTVQVHTMAIAYWTDISHPQTGSLLPTHFSVHSLEHLPPYHLRCARWQDWRGVSAYEIYGHWCARTAQMNYLFFLTSGSTMPNYSFSEAAGAIRPDVDDWFGNVLLYILGTFHLVLSLWMLVEYFVVNWSNFVLPHYIYWIPWVQSSKTAIQYSTWYYGYSQGCLTHSSMYWISKKLQ